MINQPDGPLTEASDVDLATEVTGMIPASHA
jgi:flagellar hook protein FlgE